MRMFVPSAEMQEGLIPAGDLAQSLDRIWFQAVPPTMAGVLRHHDTMQWYGVYIYTLQEGDPGKETAIEYMELCQVDKATGLTNVRLYREAELVNEMNLDLGGRLTIYEARRPALITDDVLSIQRALNMTLTVRTHNIQSAGSAERVLLNAQLPGTYETDAEGRKRYVPANISFGAGTINNFIGREIKNADGSVSVANPDIRYRDPVDVTMFDQSELAYTKHMYERVNQAHVLITSDATASGTSRRQALADYSSSVDVTATVIDGMFRWLLESSLRLASVFANLPKRFEGLRSAAKCRLNIGPVDVEMLRILSELRDSGFVSHEFALSESGLVDDVDSELQRVAQEQEVKQAADMEIQEQETSMLMKVKGALNGRQSKEVA